MKQKTSIKKTLMLLLLVTLLFSLVPAHSTAASPKLKKQSITLLTGQTYKNSVSNAKKVKWSTSNKKVATVNKNGTIKALQKGTATITATISKKKLKCKVKVESPTLSHENITVTKGYTAILTIKGTTQSTKWYSEDESIVTILNGTITGVAIGNTRVYASIAGKNFYCNVNVVSDAGTIKNPLSAFNEYTTDIYSYSDKIGNFTIQLLDYKDGDEAKKLVDNFDGYSPDLESNQEYIYFKFHVKYNSGEKQVEMSDVINLYTGLFSNDSTYMLDSIDWAFGVDGNPDMVNISLYPGGEATFSTTIVIQKGYTPVTYRLETGYDKKSFNSLYTWFTTKK